MSNTTSSDAAKAVVRRNTEEVQSRGNFDVFEELFARDFVDHTPNRAGLLIETARESCTASCAARSPTSTLKSIGRLPTAIS
jgi:hypothetical protein